MERSDATAEGLQIREGGDISEDRENSCLNPLAKSTGTAFSDVGNVDLLNEIEAVYEDSSKQLGSSPAGEDSTNTEELSPLKISGNSETLNEGFDDELDYEPETDETDDNQADSPKDAIKATERLSKLKVNDDSAIVAQETTSGSSDASKNIVENPGLNEPKDDDDKMDMVNPQNIDPETIEEKPRDDTTCTNSNLQNIYNVENDDQSMVDDGYSKTEVKDDQPILGDDHKSIEIDDQLSIDTIQPSNRTKNEDSNETLVKNDSISENDGSNPKTTEDDMKMETDAEEIQPNIISEDDKSTNEKLEDETMPTEDDNKNQGKETNDCKITKSDNENELTTKIGEDLNDHHDKVMISEDGREFEQSINENDVDIHALLGESKITSNVDTIDTGSKQREAPVERSEEDAKSEDKTTIEKTIEEDEEATLQEEENISDAKVDEEVALKEDIEIPKKYSEGKNSEDNKPECQDKDDGSIKESESIEDGKKSTEEHSGKMSKKGTETLIQEDVESTNKEYCENTIRENKQDYDASSKDVDETSEESKVENEISDELEIEATNKLDKQTSKSEEETTSKALAPNNIDRDKAKPEVMLTKDENLNDEDNSAGISEAKSGGDGDSDEKNSVESAEDHQKFKTIEEMLSTMGTLSDKHETKHHSQGKEKGKSEMSSSDLFATLSGAHVENPAGSSTDQKDSSTTVAQEPSGEDPPKQDDKLPKSPEPSKSEFLNGNKGSTLEEVEQAPPPVVKRGRGRPRKNFNIPPKPKEDPEEEERKNQVKKHEFLMKKRKYIQEDKLSGSETARKRVKRRKKDDDSDYSNDEEADPLSSQESRPTRVRKINPKYKEALEDLNLVNAFLQDSEPETSEDEIVSRKRKSDDDKSGVKKKRKTTTDRDSDSSVKLVDINRILSKKEEKQRAAGRIGEDMQVAKKPNAIFSPNVLKRLQKIKETKKEDVSYESLVTDCVKKCLNDGNELKSVNKSSEVRTYSNKRKESMMAMQESMKENVDKSYVLVEDHSLKKKDKMRPRFIAFKRIVKNIKQVKLPSKNWQVKLGLSESNKVIQVTCSDIVNKRSVQLSCFKSGYEIVFDGKYMRLIGAPDFVDTLHELSILLSIVNNINPNDALLESKY